MSKRKREEKRTTQGRGRFRFLPNALPRKPFALRCPVLIRKTARWKRSPFSCLSTFSWARGHERLPPVSAPFRGFLSRLACWASAQRRSLGATIPRKTSAHRCFTVFTEQICDESRRRPRIILSYSQGLQRRVGANLPAKTDRGSSPLAPARAKRKWTPT